MTEDFKNNLKEYFTGNLIEETGVDVPQFQEPITNNKNVRKQIADLKGISVSDVIVNGQLHNNNYNTFLIYGYINIDGEKEYYVVLFDEDVNLIQYINKFTSGASLFSIMRMEQAEDGTIYALSQETDYTIRVLLLNNIFASNINSSEYNVRIRASYIKPSSVNFQVMPVTCSKDTIIKVPNESTYFLTGYGRTGVASTKVIKFTINVGAENTWDLYEFDENTFIGQSKFSVLLNKTGSGYEYNIYGLDTNTFRYREFKIDTDGNITNIKNINTDFNWLTSEVMALNDQNIYLARTDFNVQKAILSKVEGNSFVNLYEIPFYEYQPQFYRDSYITLKRIGNNVFLANYRCDNNFYYVEYGMVIGSQVYILNNSRIKISYSYYGVSSIFNEFFITNSYNLYTLILMGDIIDDVSEYGSSIINLIYNTNNYNGAPFKDRKSMLPSSSNLYSNNKLIFARDLYNKTINNSTTTSTLQIPNTMLNDITIEQEDLISENNNTIVENTQNINKNIFEELNINFINTILMKNANDPNNIIINQLGANRINNSVSNLLDYDNAKMGKYRINFIDNTQTIGSNVWAPIGNYYRTQISVLPNKEVTSIEFISNDENTIYQIIRPSLQVGYIYKIKQDVYIDTKTEPNEVYYGVDEVFYNDEKVYY